MTRSQRVRDAQDEGRRGVSVFVTPPRMQRLAATRTAPPSSHVPSRVGLRAVLHKLACPSCCAEGQLVLNGTHGARRSVKCTAPKPNGRACGRSWAGQALARAVDDAWNSLQEAMLAEQQGNDSDKIPDDGVHEDEAIDQDEEHVETPAMTRLRDLERQATGAEWTGDRFAVMITDFNANLARSQNLLVRAQDREEELRSLLMAERARADQLAEKLKEAEAKIRSSATVTAELDGTDRAQERANRPSFATIVRQQQQQQQQQRAGNTVEADMLAEMRRIGAIAPARAVPTWRGVTAVYLRNLNRCPVGQLRAIIGSAVHRDAAIAVSFIGQNVAEILCARNRIPSLKNFMATMGAVVIEDYRPEAETTGQSRRGVDHDGNRKACIARWQRELGTCPVRARDWYRGRLEEIGEMSPDGRADADEDPTNEVTQVAGQDQALVSTQEVTNPTEQSPNHEGQSSIEDDRDQTEAQGCASDEDGQAAEQGLAMSAAENTRNNEVDLADLSALQEKCFPRGSTTGEEDDSEDWSSAPLPTPALRREDNGHSGLANN
jgi:hypothetical protein